MIAAYVNDLERLVSKPRLDRYRPANGDDLETAVRYLWNIALSEALLQGVANLEVGLRNSIHATLSAHVGTEYWFQAILRPNEMRTVNEAWTQLSKRHQSPPTPGKVVAELTFGFWPSLFTKEYQNLWWSNKTALLKTVFPHVPPGNPLTPKLIHERTELLRNLRNRVMHHEPIFMGITPLNRSTVALTDIHEQMVELLGWIHPQLALTLSFVDRFPDVFRHEEMRIRNRLKAHFNTP